MNSRILQLIIVVGVLTTSTLLGCQAESSASSGGSAEVEGRAWKLICLGDGLTAGSGLPADAPAYPAHLAELLGRERGPVKVVNAGLKGESLRAASQRLPWMFQQRFDALLIALGDAEIQQAQELPAWIADWELLLSQVRNLDPELDLWVTILATTVPPTSYQEAVQELCPRYGARYLEWPVKEWIEEPDYWSHQGGEPFCSPAGQLRLAELLVQTLRNLSEGD